MRMTDELTTRILLYSHDSYGLGHLRRTLAIAWGLSDAFPRASLLCVTGSPRAHSFPFPPRTDYLKLPAVTKDESGRYVPLKLRIPIEQLLAVRAAAIERAVLEYKPHASLVDHAPLGLGGELVGTLRRVKAERPETRIVIGLRDICDDGPLVRESWHREGVGEALSELYDRILVYGQPAIFDVVREYGLADACARKLHYTGYIWRSERDHASAAALPGPEAPMVLVTVGGGADGHPIMPASSPGRSLRPPRSSCRHETP